MAFEAGAVPIRTAAQAGAFLEELALTEALPYGARAPFALQAVRRLLARTGEPHRRLRVIHIAGSKGKGSTALFTEAILQAAGLRTGTFTSPHLERWTERFRINGREIDGAWLACVLEQLRPHVEALKTEHPDHPPSFFDAATAAALLLFQQEGVAWAVIEAGIGGRLDATNIVAPAVTCISSVELEHTDKLGHTLAAIAREKAGIVKPGIPVVTGALPPEAAAQVEARARAVGAPLVRLGQEIQVSIEKRKDEGLALRFASPALRINATLPLPGEHLARNAALAAACVERLGLLGPAELAEAVQRGLANAHLPGRSEILCRRPWVIIDAAHTQVSAEALAAVLAGIPAEAVHLVLSVSPGKDLPALLAPLLARAQTVTATRADPVRSLDAEAVAAAVRAQSPDLALRVVANPLLAVREAYRALAPQALLCATGSVYMAGIARSALAESIAR